MLVVYPESKPCPLSDTKHVPIMDLYHLLCLPQHLFSERTFAWLSTWRRPSKDYEVLPSSEVAWISIAMIRIILRR
jgi:transposase